MFGCSESLRVSAVSEGLGVLGQKGACGRDLEQIDPALWGGGLGV